MLELVRVDPLSFVGWFTKYIYSTHQKTDMTMENHMKMYLQLKNVDFPASHVRFQGGFFFLCSGCRWFADLCTNTADQHSHGRTPFLSILVLYFRFFMYVYVYVVCIYSFCSVCSARLKMLYVDTTDVWRNYTHTLACRVPCKTEDLKRTQFDSVRTIDYLMWPGVSEEKEALSLYIGILVWE